MGRALRVALVTEFYYPHLGGVTEHVYHFSRELAREGHAPLVITSHMSPQTQDAPFVRRVGRSVTLPSNGSLARITVGTRLGRQIADILKAERIDIVHVHGGLAPTLGLVAPRAAHRIGIPVVTTFHSWFRRSVGYRFYRAPLQKSLDQIAAKIAVSEPVVEALSRYFRASWDVIPNGIDLDDFGPDGRLPSDTRIDEPQLLFLGRLDPRNGLDVVLAAMPRIVEAYPRARLTVAGDGPLRPWYESLARPLGKNVEFIGSIYRERAQRYAASDLYLCPTNKASFGITLLEAMACGTPMIVSEITGFRELIDGGSEAMLVPPADPGRWAEATIALIRDPKRRGLMSRAGLQKAARFGWPTVAQQVLGVYRRVLGIEEPVETVEAVPEVVGAER